MLIHWQSHKEYLFFLHEQKIYFDSSQKLRLQSEFAAFREKLVLLNLDKAMEFLQQLYPPFGRPAVNQTQILRSFILFLLFFKSGRSSGLSAWVKRLKSDPVLAALVGCTADSLPPLGSYFDFMDRLWLAHDNTRYSRSRLFPESKNGKKPEKPGKKGQKVRESRKGITLKIARYLINGGNIPFNFEAILQQLLLITAVRPSLSLGLIPAQNLTLSGDGTCLHTHASPYGRPTDHPSLRRFSDPDACGVEADIFHGAVRLMPAEIVESGKDDWGWDSDLNDHFFGYNLYPLSFHNREQHLDLPLFFRISSSGWIRRAPHCAGPDTA